MSSISVLYYADATTLPDKLPTVEEIESSQDILRENSTRKIVGVGQHFVVKYGPRVNLLEGEHMLFIQQATSVPIPRVYALFKDFEGMIGYIVMERIAGEVLTSEWPSLSLLQKEIIAHKLRANFNEIRKLPSPGGFCSLGKRPLLNDFFWTPNEMSPGAWANPLAGPFQTEPEFNDSILKRYMVNKLPQKANFYRRIFPSVFNGHSPVFSHGDFQRKNIILRKVLLSDDGKQSVPDYEPVILDWEFSGWYPSYWDYSHAILACGTWKDDWNLWVGKILDPFLNEFAWWNMIWHEVFW